MATCKDCERWHQKFYCFCGDAFGNERNDVERVCKDFKKIEENIMNREILFRGKLPAYGDWVYGYLNQHRGKPIIDTSGMEIYSSDYFINDFMAKVDTDIYGEIYKVKPETVGQYTGLTDKNGKKIFEGDVVKFIGMVGQIVFEGGSFGIAFQKQIDWDKFENEIKLYTRCDNLACVCFNDNFVSLWEIYWNFNEEDNSLGLAEIIGNIHDNKLEDF